MKSTLERDGREAGEKWKAPHAGAEKDLESQRPAARQLVGGEEPARHIRGGEPDGVETDADREGKDKENKQAFIRRKMKRIKNPGEGKRRKLQYISLWICIAALWINQLYHSHYEYQVHQKFCLQYQQVLQGLENQLEESRERTKELREISDLLETLQGNQK